MPAVSGPRRSCSLEVRGGAHDCNHAVVDEGLWQRSAALAHDRCGLPRYVLRELEGFRACGDPKRELARRVLRVALGVVARWYRRRAGAPTGKAGSGPTPPPEAGEKGCAD